MTRAGRKVRPRFSRCFHQWNRCLLLRKLSATNEYMSPQGHVRQGSWTKEGAAEILRCAQDDRTPGCHPFASLRAGSERELWICGAHSSSRPDSRSLADFWRITRIVDLINSAICAKILFCDEIELYDKLMHFTYLAHMNSAWHKRSRL